MIEKLHALKSVNRDSLYFISLAIIIISMIGQFIYHKSDADKIKYIEEKIILHLDNEICERLRFLEQVSKGFQETGRAPAECNAYSKLELRRILEK